MITLRMKTVFLLLALSTATFAQVTQRNLLTTHYMLDDIKRELITRNNWKPYPTTAAEWKAHLPPDVVDEIVKRGEETAKKEVPPVPATLLLEFVRNGKRSN